MKRTMTLGQLEELLAQAKAAGADSDTPVWLESKSSNAASELVVVKNRNLDVVFLYIADESEELCENLQIQEYGTAVLTK